MNSAVRDEALRLYLLGWSVPDIANNLNVTISTIHRWIPKDHKRRAHVQAGRTGEYVKGEDLARVMHDCMDTSDYRHRQLSAAGTAGGQKNLGKLRSDGYNNRHVPEQREIPLAPVSPFARMSSAIGMHQSTLERYYRNSHTDWVDFASADKVLTYLGAHWRFNVDVPVHRFMAGRSMGCV